ncbi:MAG: thioredoxin domain-containing protein [Myxococcota bacterium]|nr:thioredoxin domain-containing protein [Myxococcota bacterium]
MQSERSVGAIALAASLVPVFAGLAASAMLAVDTIRPIPVFCSDGGGCEAVRHTALAAPLGVPLPFLGLAGFLALGVAALVEGRRARLTQLALAAAAGSVGVLLLGAQAVLGRFCVYCAVVDTCGIVSAVIAAARWNRAPQARAPVFVVLAGSGALLVAVAGPLALGLRAKAMPRVIRDEIAHTRTIAPAAVTLVDFVDFECPFCRMTHAELEPLVLAHRDRIRVVRRQVPLRIHPHAYDAARAACCGERLGKGDEMASALFSEPAEQLTPGHCERIAERLGLELGAFRACVSDRETDASIEADRAEFKAAGGFALPTLWLDDRELVGAQPKQVLAKLLDEVLSQHEAGGS